MTAYFWLLYWIRRCEIVFSRMLVLPLSQLAAGNRWLPMIWAFLKKSIADSHFLKSYSVSRNVARVSTNGTDRLFLDASKEHVIVLHPVQSQGATFKLLGCMIETDLRMQSAIDQLTAKGIPKIIAILRTRAYYSLPQRMMQFKTHSCGLIEASMGDFFMLPLFKLQKSMPLKIDFCVNWVSSPSKHC